ncbi:MAG: zinc ABC transporter substrate-binding protein [Elusimicrobia bacterium]|nr:zinc ABC transporter substrate-binding protein [Elusimicrobiota bacterium]
MKTLILTALLTSALGATAQARTLRVLATFPELADIAREVGGKHVSVQGIARGTEDPHQIVMKPSFVTKLNRADAVVYNGLTLEHSFLPGLLETASNPRMRADTFRTCLGQGCIDCSEGLHVLDKPADISRSQGELHPYGNPHYDVDPANGLLVARNIEKGLARIDPAHAADYAANLKAYEKRLEAKLAVWRRMAAPLKGVKAVSFHEDVDYLAAFTGLDFVGTIEDKPGVPPTPPHLVKLVQLMKDQGVKLIVREQQYAPQTSDWLAAQTGAKVAVIGVMANAFPGTATFIDYQQHNLEALLQAAGK